MKQEHILTKISLGIDIAVVIVLIVYFIATAPDKPVMGFEGLLILTPPFFGMAGLIAAAIGRSKRKSVFTVVLMVINSIFLCWWPIMHFGVTWLFGP